MFSRVASTVARAAPARAAATARRVSSRAGASAALSGFSAAGTAGVLAVTAAAGLAAIAGSETRQQQESALCAAAGPAKYTGEPGTAYERSFIVSVTAFCPVNVCSPYVRFLCDGETKGDAAVDHTHTMQGPLPLSVVSRNSKILVHIYHSARNKSRTNRGCAVLLRVRAASTSSICARPVRVGISRLDSRYP